MAQKAKYLSKKKQKAISTKQTKPKKTKPEVLTDAKKPSLFFIKLKRVLDLWPYWSIVPILILIGIVPLIVYGKIIELTPLMEQNWIGGTYHIDFFSWYKMVWILWMTGILVLFSLVLILTKRIKFKKNTFYLPLFIYILFSIVSAIFAADPFVATRGYMDMFQGIYVIISYALLVLIMYHLVQHEQQVKLIIGAFIFLGLIVSVIGFYQYIGEDLIRTENGLKLILSKDLEIIIPHLQFIFGKYDIYATMGNTNFVGSFAALMIPIAFALYLQSKGLILNLFTMMFMGLMVFVGFGSNSRAGIIGVFVALLLILIFFRKFIFKKPLKVIVPFVIMISLGYMLNQITEGRVSSEFESINPIQAIKDAKTYAENRVFITRLEVDNNTLIIETEEEGIVLTWRNDGIWPYSLDGDVLEVNVSGRNVTFKDERYQNFRLVLSEDRVGYLMHVYGRSFEVRWTLDGLYVRGSSGYLVKPIMPDRVESLDDYGILFSNRAFIWSRSIPLLKDYILIGSGPDHYPIVYPQADIAGKLNYMGLYTIVDKPHNMYLQTGINTGVISLLGMLSFFAVYIIQSISLYVKKESQTALDFIGMGCFISVLAYLAAGFFNDQVVSVAPLFYIVIGLGFAINSILRSKTKYSINAQT